MMDLKELTQSLEHKLTNLILEQPETIENEKDFQKVNSLSNHNTFPQIFLDDVFFGGYDELSKQAKYDYLKSFK